MARRCDLSDKSLDELKQDLSRSFQSGHINYLLGAGASYPAVPLAGPIEQDINTLRNAGNDAEAAKRICDLLSAIQAPSNRIIEQAGSPDERKCLQAYERFLNIVESVINERRTNILPKQATVFTTNYDVFLDVASRACAGLRLSSGFSHATSADDVSEYSSGTFFLSTYDSGNLYDYRVELPCLNLVKLHGCISWQKDGERIVRRSAKHDVPTDLTVAAAITDFNSRYAVVLPQQSKFASSVIDRTYYELLRLYSNALDRANVLLIAFGFSFSDEHILQITRRALKNPTLRLVVFAYESDRENRRAVGVSQATLVDS